MDPAFHQAIFKIKDQKTFRDAALKVFLYQSRQTPVYGEYLQKLGIDPVQISRLEEIPFLPVEQTPDITPPTVQVTAMQK